MLVNRKLQPSEIVLASEVGGQSPPLQPTEQRDISLDAYHEFLRRKATLAAEHGLEFSPSDVNPLLKPHQRDTVLWAARGGRRAIFAAFGLGKTFMQLEILRLILSRIRTEKQPAENAPGGNIFVDKALIVAPLGVRQEFMRDAAKLGTRIRFIRSFDETSQLDAFDVPPRIFITNYETVRDGKLDPSRFAVTSLDEAAVLRSFVGTKTYREFMRLFEHVKYRFVATATPDPNEFIELLSYSAYLGIMDVSQAKTRFFKRDSTKADHLTLHPHKEEEFWLWVSSWALFLQRPSDLGYSDDGYDLPPVQVHYHEVPLSPDNGAPARFERDGQAKMFRDALGGITDAAREKRESLQARIEKVVDICCSEPVTAHYVLWHDLEDERKAIERELPGAVSVYGSQKLEEKEQAIIDFSDGKIALLAGKPQMLGSGCNFQRHCSRAIFCGIGFKFNDFIQAVHRIHRFLQTEPVDIHLIYSEAERGVLQNLKAKWQRYEERAKLMSEIIREYGLSQQAMIQTLVRSMGSVRVEVAEKPRPKFYDPPLDCRALGDNELMVNEANWQPCYRLIQNDAVEEAQTMPENSVGLILTSIPFSTQYEYSPSFNDFGHTESNRHFFEQMEFLTPHLFRILQPGRIAAIHVKDRIVPGGITGLGFQTVYPFHADCIRHYTSHGFGFLGMKTVVTDVVRENNQTYRLGWTEQCKDGTKMGVGMPEYLLLFRKPPTDPSNAYADNPVVKLKRKYTRRLFSTPSPA